MSSGNSSLGRNMFNWGNKNKDQKPAPQKGPQARGNAQPGQQQPPQQNRPQNPNQQRPQQPPQRPGPQGAQNQRPPQPRPAPQPMRMPQSSISGVTVYFNPETIRCVKPNGDIEALRWDELGGVIIMVSSEGPYSYDMQWVLAGKKDGGCVFPNTAAGASEIIRYMQDTLKGFNNAEIIKAMDSKDNGKFVIWRPVHV